MDGDRITRALARIEAAVGRIEAAGRSGASSDNKRDPALPDTAFEAKYQALRQQAAAALAEVDQLIAVLEQ